MRPSFSPLFRRFFPPPAGPAKPASHPAFRHRKSSGIALVLVLGMLALVVVLMVAFVSSVSTELQSAKSYASGQDVRSLADSTVNIVISQIQDATANPRLAWASQPGMIRTYDGAGNASMSFKLYSSDQLRVPGNFDPAANLSTEVPGDWASNPGQFTDMNKPVPVEGSNHYPIISPSAVAENASGNTALAGTAPAIEGCYLDTSNAAVQITADQANPMPLPVRWMYVLKNGEIAPLNRSTQKIAGATRDNPIIGRVAFWTDDETAKVNINTSSEGTYWDRPWTEGTAYERNLANRMPVQNEFQRYPGHPAMTSLSVIFPPLAGENTQAYNERIYGIIPRVVGGGSQSGTANVTGATAALVPDTQRLFASVDEFLFQSKSGPPRELNPKGPAANFTQDDIERARFFLTANSRAPEVNLFNKPRITLWPLQLDPDPVSGNATRNSKDKLIAFCSTIGSKPYYFQRYNTYNSANPNTRLSSQDPLMDWNEIIRNRELYAYLQHLTASPIPGLGGSLLAKYPNSRDQILTEMFDFVRSGVNTFSGGETPKYYYTPFNLSGFTTGQSQIVPSVLPNGTKGFGRFPTVTEAALVFYRQDKLTYRKLDSSGNPEGPVEDVPDTEISISGKVMVYENTPPPNPLVPLNIGAVLILEAFNPTPGPPPWSGNVRFVIKGLNGLMVSGSTAVTPFPSPAVNLVTGPDSSVNATALTGLEQYFQYKSTSTKFSMPKTLGSASEETNYPFFASFTLPAGSTTMNFPGNTITIEIYPGSATVTDATTLVQKITMNFPRVLGLPVPTVGYSQSYNAASNLTKLSSSNRFRDYNKRIDYYRDPDDNGSSGKYGIAEDYQHSPLPLILSSDTVRSAEARYGGPARGDYRMFAGLKEVPETYFEGHGLKDTPKGSPASSRRLYGDIALSSRLIHSLTIDGMAGSSDASSENGYYTGTGFSATADPRGKLISGAAYPDPNRGDTIRNRKVPAVPRGLDEALMANGSPGDWDTGPGHQPDGPYINKADEATAKNNSLYYYNGDLGSSSVVESGASFSPNRQIASAVAFGSLPSGIDPANPANAKPWQTLLFCKNPAAGAAHPGFGFPASGPPYSTAPDHAFLDFFTMPIVEPYAISEPFSTAGKVNMNYQIAPFTYLTRSTGMRAVLKSCQVMAIPQSDADKYKLNSQNPPAYRYTLNPDEQTGTLAGLEQRFDSGDIFRSASEICGIYLVPRYLANTTTPAPGSPTYATMAAWWNGYRLTGDNVREGPYGHLYPKLTTKSNTFTVHLQTQSLQKTPGSPADAFVEGKDQITGEFRGSFIIERYLDPGADSLFKADGTPAAETDPDSMVGPYKFRIIRSKRFAP